MLTSEKVKELEELRTFGAVSEMVIIHKVWGEKLKDILLRGLLLCNDAASQRTALLLVADDTTVELRIAVPSAVKRVVDTKNERTY